MSRFLYFTHPHLSNKTLCGESLGTRLIMETSFWCKICIEPSCGFILPSQKIWKYPIVAYQQCDQMVRLVINIWPFTKIKIISKDRSANVGTKFSLKLNKPLKHCKILSIFCQNGKILPNLDTLPVNKKFQLLQWVCPNLSLI